MVEQKDKHFTFEDPSRPNNSTNPPSSTSASPSSPSIGASSSVQEWLDTIERATELARSQNLLSHSANGSLRRLPLLSRSISSLGPDASTLDFDGLAENHHNNHVTPRKRSSKHPNGTHTDGDELGGPSIAGVSGVGVGGGSSHTNNNTNNGNGMGMGIGIGIGIGGRKKFGKRHSKNGLTAVF